MDTSLFNWNDIIGFCGIFSNIDNKKKLPKSIGNQYKRKVSDEEIIVLVYNNIIRLWMEIIDLWTKWEGD